MQLTLYPNSLVEHDQTVYALGRLGAEKFLRVRGDATGFQEPVPEQDGTYRFPLSPANAAQLRRRLPWLTPQPLGLRPSFGLGDRLALATPGHIRAIRGSGIAPIFAQQSVRENARTKRTPQQVLDDALWGIFQEGWRDDWGADADHLKTVDDITPFVTAGYTFFTVDPGEYVDHTLHTFEALPWDVLQDSVAGLRTRYLHEGFAVEGQVLRFTEERLLQAAAKYGRAIAHAVVMYREIARQKRGAAFDFEVSVDETETPTSRGEHFYIANELRRLNVRVTSLAPRFEGRFEKGVDFIGDLAALRVNLEEHARLARHFGYKLSLHSGSDKLSVYPLFAACTRGAAHVKTAGTSYLEALRVISRVNPPLFREILSLARERYPTERASYHVSASVERVPAASALSDAQLPELLNEFDARQVLHVTFSAVLHALGGALYDTLRDHEEEYANTLQRHFAAELAPFRQTP